MTSSTTNARTLWTARTLMKHLGVPSGNHGRWGKEMRKAMTPVFEQGTGSGTTYFYDDADIQVYIAKWKADHLPKPAAVQPVAVEQYDRASALLKRLIAQSDGILDEVREIDRVQMQKVTEQNRLLLVAINKLSAKVEAIVMDLGIKETPTALNGGVQIN